MYLERGNPVYEFSALIVIHVDYSAVMSTLLVLCQEEHPSCKLWHSNSPSFTEFLGLLVMHVILKKIGYKSGNMWH